MSFESCIEALKAELILKFSSMKKEHLFKINNEEKRSQLINKIQFVVRKILEDIAHGLCPVLKTSFPDWENCTFDGRLKLKDFDEKIRRIDFRRMNSRADFAAIIFLFSKIYKLLVTQQTSTRRELYYENLEIFKSQKQVDKGIREICNLLKSPTWELRVFATSKGIVSGPVVLTLANGELVDCGKNGGVCIPQNVLEIKKVSSSATWVLVIEKDASFQKLLNPEASLTLGSCILITGKGFPDVNSRILVCKFWEFLKIPILALVDADPHGFEIMCVYRFGSLTMSPYSENLACPAVRWLGVHPSDIKPLLLDSKTMSLHDVRKTHLLLKRSYVKGNENLKTQLEILLEGNVKAEIEGVTSISSNYLSDVYVRNKIRCREYL